MKNNIFDFATKELAQDAFLCWCVNWFNDDSNPVLKEMAVNLARKFSGLDDITSIEIHRQFSEKPEHSEKPVKIDVLLVVNTARAVIIEDKIYASEHDDQIARYAEGLRGLVQGSKPEDWLHAITSIRTVYLKTGFFYDNDKCVKADVIIDGEGFREMLNPYRGNSEILDSYLENLDSILDWYKVYGVYEGSSEDFWSWNIASEQIAQYRLMRDIFPEDLWVDRSSWLYYVEHGSNRGGRPWTELNILLGTNRDTGAKFYFFWRIDTDTHGPYISLRFYEVIDIKRTDDRRKAMMENHREKYETVSAMAREIIDGNPDRFCFTWKDVYPGYRGGSKEADLVHIRLLEPLQDWANAKDEVIRSVRNLTDLFCSEFEKRRAEF